MDFNIRDDAGVAHGTVRAKRFVALKGGPATAELAKSKSAACKKCEYDESTATVGFLEPTCVSSGLTAN